MQAGANGLPDPATRRPSSTPARPDPVDLEIGPGGDLFYVDFDGGHDPADRATSPATSRRTPSRPRNPTAEPLPLTVNFNGAGRATRTATALTYAWDLDGDGAFDDSTVADAEFTYTTRGTVHGARCG